MTWFSAYFALGSPARRCSTDCNSKHSYVSSQQLLYGSPTVLEGSNRLRLSKQQKGKQRAMYHRKDRPRSSKQVPTISSELVR
jgi:hypothetical protein